MRGPGKRRLPNYSPVGRRPVIAAQAVSAAPWASVFRSTYDSWGVVRSTFYPSPPRPRVATWARRVCYAVLVLKTS